MKMDSTILLCSDLDRTIIPNGDAKESKQARPLLRKLASRPEIVLVYVTGRNKQLIIEAIKTWQLPVPDYAIGDVGSSIYDVVNGWSLIEAWHQEIAADWNGKSQMDLASMIDSIYGLTLQEPEKQNTYKLSYYTDARNINVNESIEQVKKQFDMHNIRAEIIWSFDEVNQLGLLDIIPQRATKRHAILFLINHLGFSLSQTVFAGDSGNDLSVLTSMIPAILVKNASPEVVYNAKSALDEKEIMGSLYRAQGNFLGMNGNYAAGLIEGLVRFKPEVMSWIMEY